MSACDTLNLFVVGERSFTNTVTVCDPSTLFYLLRRVVSFVPFPPRGNPVNSYITPKKQNKLFNIIVVSN